MAYIEPNGELYLLNVPFDPNYENTMYFASVADQTTWMLTKTTRHYMGLSYTRKSRGKIRVEDTIAHTYNANYMMYRNANFENKWFYAFVNSVEYINNITVEINFTIDVMQTWLPNIDYQFNDCFIERQHEMTDNVGDNIIPEKFNNFETTWSNNSTASITFTPVIVLYTSLPKTSSWWPTYGVGKVYQGRVAGAEYYSGLTYVLFNPAVPADVTRLNDLLDGLVEVNLKESIVAIFMGCAEFFDDSQGTPNPVTMTVARNTTISGYIPRNKKLLTYPYNYLEVYSPEHNSKIYKYELFNTPGSCTFSIWGNRTTNPGMYMFPLNYRGNDAYFEGISSFAFPPCCFTYDAFKAWWAQNKGVVIANFAQGQPSVVEGATQAGQAGYQAAYQDYMANYWMAGHSTPSAEFANTEGLAGGTGAAIGSAATAIALKAELSLMQMEGYIHQAPGFSGSSAGDLAYQFQGIQFNFYRRHLLLEYAYKIDAYFDMYGYAQKKVGKPNTHARPCWTFVKTIGCNLNGNIPADDEKQIEAIFDNGIRFWKTTATFGSYDPLVNNNSYVS